MRIFCVLALPTLIVAALSSAYALNNDDIIKMKRADFSEETIMLSIAKEPADYDTSTDALIALKKAGLSEAVIQKMLAAQHGGKTTTTATAAQPAASAASWADQELPSIAPPMIDPVVGQNYFLASSLHFEDGKYMATNYARGVLVPINTPVKLESIRGDTITLRRTDTGETLKVENVQKYTRKSTTQLASLLLTGEETPLNKLPEELANAIRNGDMRKGMTKEQVLMARGYPPAHETSSTESDRWVYWSSRFVKQTILFSNGRLSEGRGIN